MGDHPLPSAPHASGPWLPWLDGWRGLSLLLVIVGHLTRFDLAGRLGVEMFFVLSGRLMAELLVIRRQPLPAFLWRRMARVWPALWTYVGMVGAALSVSWLFGDQRHALTGALAALTFTANYVEASVSMPYFDHAWSLAVEEHAYLLLALIVLLARRRAGVAAGVALGLAALAMVNGAVQVQLLGHDRYYTYLQSDVRVASVLLPFALHLMWRAGRPGWVAPAAIAVGLWLGIGEPGLLRFGLGTAALAMAVVTLDGAPRALRSLLATAPLRWAGLASFSLYLWQQPFMLFYRAGTSSALCIAGALSLGAWSYLRVERPARRRLIALGPGHLRRRLVRLAPRLAMDRQPTRP